MAATASASAIDLVVTRYREPLAWLWPYLDRPGWSVYIYNTGKKPPPARVCARAAQCSQVPNAGFEWHGYLRHIVDRYDRLAELTIFLQGDPFTVSPECYKKLNDESENFVTGILEMEVGAKDAFHHHKDHLIYVLEGDGVTIYPGGDESAAMAVPLKPFAGIPAPMVAPPFASHVLENTGTIPLKMLFFEAKK